MPIEIKNKKFYRLDELSEMLGLHIDTIRRKIREKKLRAHKLGRDYIVEEDSLDKFIRNN